MRLQELQKSKAEIAAAAYEYGARKLRVLGSVARGGDTATSDFDFLVTFPRKYSLVEQRLPLTRRPEEITSCKLD